MARESKFLGLLVSLSSSKAFVLLFVCINTIHCLLPTMAQNTTEVGQQKVNVGVILDLKTIVGRVGFNCVKMAVSEFYTSHNLYKTRIVLHERDSNGKVLGAVTAVEDLIRNVHVNAIIGPQSSMQANTLINLGEEDEIPLISFTATSPALSFLRSSNFIRAALNDSYQVQVITAILKAYSWREVVPIYVGNEFGEGIIPSLSDEMQNNNIRIKHRSVINPLATSLELEAELYKLMTMQTRVFVVHMAPHLGALLFAKAKEIGMMSKGYVWIVTDAITGVLNSLDVSVILSMRGVLGIKPYVPRTRKLVEFLVRYSTIQQEKDEPSIYGLWAYDATIALALAIERVGSKIITNFSSNGNLEVSDEFGQNLSKALSNIQFEGLSGHFKIFRGQLVSTTYEIINVVGQETPKVGFWTPKYGLMKEVSTTLNSNDPNVDEEDYYSTSRDNLGTVIWPGGGTAIPNGWVIPTNGKKLRIGVPETDAFPEFVRLKIDAITSSSVAVGFSIDVFDAVMAALPYHVPYEYIPFTDSEGKMLGDYNNLVYQVFLERYDAVVGDVTILANRSSYVEFTLPYTESGVVLVVPYIAKNNIKAAWIFLKPLTWQLWLVSGCFFLWVGIVICILETCSTLRNNRDAEGNDVDQGGEVSEPNLESRWFRCCVGHHTRATLYSTFTNLVDNKEQVVSSLTRFVVILWCLVVLILTQSYTASLASMLTVSQLEPTVNDIHEIASGGQGVACQKNSFVRSLLKELNFTDSNIKTYDSTQELHAMFKNRTIGAVFDEIPYMRIFLAKYCGKYTMIQPPVKTNGFGFVFPIGSPLVHDVSKAVLNATEEQNIKLIERAWLEQEDYCSENLHSTTSASLGIESFWGLFVVIGVGSVLALIACLSTFLYDHRATILRVIFRRIKNKVEPVNNQTENISLSVSSSARSSVAHEGTSGNTVSRVGRCETFPSTPRNNRFLTQHI